jgi:hypothetical protein
MVIIGSLTDPSVSNGKDRNRGYFSGLAPASPAAFLAFPQAGR